MSNGLKIFRNTNIISNLLSSTINNSYVEKIKEKDFTIILKFQNTNNNPIISNAVSKEKIKITSNDISDMDKLSEMNYYYKIN